MWEILFRGKDPETGKWYEGFYMALSDTTYCFKEDYAAHPDNTKHYIVFDEMTDWGLPNRHLRADVDPTTVGQYTGLNDKNGKRIFEGDIVKADNGAHSSISVVKFGEYSPKMFYAMLAICCPGTQHLNANGFYLESTKHEDMILFKSRHLEVIGNITDNPELLEK